MASIVLERVLFPSACLALARRLMVSTLLIVRAAFKSIFPLLYSALCFQVHFLPWASNIKGLLMFAGPILAVGKNI